MPYKARTCARILCHAIAISTRRQILTREAIYQKIDIWQVLSLNIGYRAKILRSLLGDIQFPNSLWTKLSNVFQWPLRVDTERKFAKMLNLFLILRNNNLGPR